MEPPPFSGHEEAHLERRVRLGQRELEGFPGFGDDDLRGLLTAPPQGECDLPDELAPLDGRDPGPAGPGAAGGSDRSVHVGGSRTRDAAS